MTDDSHEHGKGTGRPRQSRTRIISQGKDVTAERQKKMEQHRKVVRMAKKKLVEMDSKESSEQSAVPTKASPDELLGLAHRIHEREKAGEDVANPKMKRLKLKAKSRDEH